MRYLLLLAAGLLAGCHSVQLSSPVSAPSDTKPSLSQTQADRSVELVNSKKVVGHRDFNNSKKVLPDIYAGMEQDFYCGCAYVKTVVKFGNCGFKPRKNPIRAGRIEWEHVVPAWVLGNQRKCWQQGGRKNCTETDEVFQMAEGDLNNLVPAIGEVNGDRSNFAYSAWTRSPVPIRGGSPRYTEIPPFFSTVGGTPKMYR